MMAFTISSPKLSLQDDVEKQKPTTVDDVAKSHVEMEKASPPSWNSSLRPWMRVLLYAFGAAAFLSLCVIVVILKIQQDGLKKELEGKPCE